MLDRIRRRTPVNPEKSKQRGARIIRFPFARRTVRASDTCDHRWIFLAPGYQMCAKCRAIRKKPPAMVEQST